MIVIFGTSENPRTKDHVSAYDYYFSEYDV